MISGVTSSPYRYQVPVAKTNEQANSSSVVAARAQTIPVQAGGGQFNPSALMDTIKEMFSSIGTFFAGMWNKLTGKVSAPAVSEDVARLAAQYNLLPTKENVDAFIAEAKSYEVPGPNGFQTLGPDSTAAEAIKQVQVALQALGYRMTPNGQYDASTQAAVKEFKADNGLHQTYKLSQGAFAVNEYLDYATYQAIQAKVAGTTPPPTVPPTAPGTLNWQAIAAQYHLQASEENVNAFLAEVKTYQAPDANGFLVMGPGYPDALQITEVQNALTKVGFPVTATGQWDAATSQAIKSFKSGHGLHQAYKKDDGNWDVNEYADFQTLQKLSSLIV